MGCYPPLAKIVSRALGKCNGGRERWREGRLELDFDHALGCQPTETHYMRPVARTVTFASNNSIYVIPPSPSPQPQQQSAPEPQRPQTPPRHEPEQHDGAPESQPQAEQPEAPAQTEDAPPQAAGAEPKPPKGPNPKRGKKRQPGRVRFGPEPPSPQQEERQKQENAQEQGPGNSSESEKAPPPPGQEPHHHGAAPAPAQGYLLRYTPSPLPRWEATPRRHEYFSGEYRSYYPTPVREGIYRIATDANRLTTIFSEENPNACTIV